MSDRSAGNRDDGDDEAFLDAIVGNPIHAYKMMKRFSIDLSRIEKDMKEDDWASQFNNRTRGHRCC